METYQSIGSDLYQAVLKVNDSLGLEQPHVTEAEDVPTQTGVEHVPTPAENDAALAALVGRMAGVGGLLR